MVVAPIRIQPLRNLTAQCVSEGTIKGNMVTLTINGSHKTFKTYGKAQPTIPIEEFHRLQGYIQAFSIEPTSHLISVKSGQIMTSSAISNITKTEVLKVFGEHNFTATQFRKFIAGEGISAGVAAEMYSQAMYHGHKIALSTYTNVRQENTMFSGKMTL